MIRYDVLAQEAFRGLVKKVLTEVSHAGLPGDHHFYIVFDTRAPGVRISARLKERYPEEMTIVIQHQFWELTVNDGAFEVGLSFSGIPEKLVVPFSAIRGFFDPSVEFAVQFPLVDENGNAADMPVDGPVRAIGLAPVSQAEGDAASVADAPEASDEGRSEAEPEPDKGGDEARGSVVSLDAFRKKP